MNNFFGMLARMKYINRWGLMRNTYKLKILRSTAWTGCYHSSWTLAVIGNKLLLAEELDAEHIAMLGIMHDTTEIITGDLPTPIKYYAPEIRDAYKKVENVAANATCLQELPEEMQECI
ncbi:YfbR-like 5'-deoxynucleotidase [Eubacterium sp.]|uniref:YfbR-like 5'-deoxynucleotidase n=1 Tax=Eubacterium sp. TaxID=142586 RepID=UPI00351FF745